MLQEQLDTQKICHKEQKEQYERMSKGYQEQLEKFEEVILNNELEISRLAEELNMHKSTRMNQTSQFQQMQKDILRFEAENIDVLQQNKKLSTKLVQMEKIIYGQSRQ